MPIRDGTGTPSARRDELVRLLIPAIAPPAAKLLSATFYPEYNPKPHGKEGFTVFHIGAQVFFAQPATSAGLVMLPAHQMHGRIVPPAVPALSSGSSNTVMHTQPYFGRVDRAPPVRP